MGGFRSERHEHRGGHVADFGPIANLPTAPDSLAIVARFCRYLTDEVRMLEGKHVCCRSWRQRFGWFITTTTARCCHLGNVCGATGEHRPKVGLTWIGKPSWLRRRSRSALLWWLCPSKAVCRGLRRRLPLRSVINRGRTRNPRKGKSDVSRQSCAPKSPRPPLRSSLRRGRSFFPCRIFALRTKFYPQPGIPRLPICCLFRLWTALHATNVRSVHEVMPQRAVGSSVATGGLPVVWPEIRMIGSQ